ncbi:MAG: metal-dependent hydrolase [Hyphomicrobiaceae bacterium]|nr:metal-dependent hydrolase [Hyphomicrobiaceae bacterium]
MKITWFGHSCFRLDLGASVLLMDPFLKGNPTFEASGLSWAAATQGVTHVALTHGHFDHIGDAAEICKITGAPVLANFELAMYVKGKGAEKIEPMNTGGTVYLPDFDLTLVNALHSSSTDVYLGNPNGIIVKPKHGPVVYHMGDTDMHAEMALIAEFHKPEIGFVPIGDRFTMGAKAAAFACKKFFKFKTVVPCHYGTFPGMLDADAGLFQAEMAGHSVMVPKVGVSFDV